MTSLNQKFRQLNWKRNFITKKIKYFIFIKFLSLFTIFLRSKKNSLIPCSVKKVLVIRNDCIGDMIVTTPFIRYLSMAGYKVYVSSRKNSLEILSNNPYVTDCFLYDDGTFSKLMRSLKIIRKHQFDLAIDARFHRRLDLRHLFFCIFVKTSHLLSYNKSNIKSFNISLPYYKTTEHVTNQLKYYLDYLDINYDSFGYDIFIDSIKDKDVDLFINNNIKPKEKFVVINPYGGSDYRCLSELQILMLCNLFKSYYQEYRIVIIGQGGNFDKLCIPSTIKFQSPSILDVFPLIKKADLVISVDTSIVHVASAFSTKCISIYMEPLLPKPDNLKSIYSREFSNYKYLLQDLFLDKAYIKKHNPNLDLQINKDIWSPNDINSKQIVFYSNSVKTINPDILVKSIKEYI
ncbi:glycosyltransferase family 9 protein [Gilliamella sp. Gris1-4]|uniref:glycosyltransferase family 9 protein n=1 Tax=Gilliamella sp. Gris1-4 TaxID=3120244 RepID=UPI00080DC078|nr:glycosyltransferase family 9 protein [Gilliamella apicola]OCG36713.1 hypothetical protein A9G31_05355 [Gilliamella apicola]OCG67951.1 hypothetical protein A9G39_03980 [Gilliamella apicola]